MSATKIIIRFPEATSDEANKYAPSLVEDLREVKDVKAETQRGESEAQDFGATIVLILGTASVTAIARGIEKWLARNGTSVIIEDEHGRVILNNVQSKDAAAIAKALSNRQ
jgi:hypothetical protein